jgi:hypothetical protein
MSEHHMVYQGVAGAVAYVRGMKAVVGGRRPGQKWAFGTAERRSEEVGQVYAILEDEVQA